MIIILTVCGGLCIFIIYPYLDTLVTIFIVYNFCITFDKAKCNTPVCMKWSSGLHPDQKIVERTRLYRVQVI